MTIKPLIILPDPILRQTSSAVERFDDSLRALADDMLETMYDAPGIGLAATQVGVMKRVLVMDCIKDGPPEPMVLINPAVIWSSEDVATYEEGCLSIPDQYADVTRPAEVRVRWLGLDGKTHERDFGGLWATCAQHEMDHLDGKLFIEYLGPIKRQLITRKMVKLKRERGRDV